MPEVSGKIMGAIGIVILTIFFLAMTPTVVDQVQGLDTSNWTFTGHDGAIALVGLVPFVWIATILMAAIVGMFVLAKHGT